MGVGAIIQRQLQRQADEPNRPPKTLEEFDAFVKERIVELDALIKEAEETIETLDVKKKDERELRLFMTGALKGLHLARAAWSWWQATR